MIQAALDFENVIEGAIAALLQSAGLTVFTSGQVMDFQKDRPRVELIYKHGATTHPIQFANPMALPDDLKGGRVASAWNSSLHTNIVTAADAEGKQRQSDMRVSVRLAYLNLGQQLNGVLLTLHRINNFVESGSSRGLHPADANSEILQITHDISVSLHQSVWTSCVRITQDGALRLAGSALRITN